MNDTLTIYSKNIYVHMSVMSLEQNQEILKLYFLRSVTRNDADHDLYHQDLFKKNMKHCHLQFEKPIDELTFDKILIVLVANKMVNADEKERLLAAYRQATFLEVAHVLYSIEEEKFKDQLFHFEGKVAVLEYKSESNPAKYQVVALKARALYEYLLQQMNEYSVHRTNSTHATFRENCRKAIDDARPAFRKHSEITQILGNSLLAIGLMGVGYLVAGLINLYRNDRFLFFKTGSESKVDRLADNLKQIYPPLMSFV